MNRDAIGSRDELYWHRATLLFLIITSLARLCLLPLLELAPDEAYYWDWSRHLAPGYYDQGPLIAYLIRITTTLFGTHEFGVRMGVWLASLGTLICVYVLTRRIASALAGFLTVLFLALTPFFTLGSLIATYDPPQVFFWSLALVFLERAFFAPNSCTQTRAWMLTGLAGGLGLLSKHTMVLLVPCLLLFLLLSPAHWFWLRRPHPYIAVLLALLCYSGVLWWNAHHDWWTFSHLFFLTKKGENPIIGRLGEFLGSQAVLLGPGLLLGCLVAFHPASREWDAIQKAGTVPSHSGITVIPPAHAEPSGRDGSMPGLLSADRFLFLSCFGLPVFGFFCLMAFKTKVQGNWASCAWLTPTILLAASLASQIERQGQGARRAVRKVWIIGAASGLLTVFMLSASLRYRLDIRLPVRADLSNTAFGWRLMAQQAEQLRSEMRKEGNPVFVAANDYQTCALLAFYLPDHPRTHDLFLGSRMNMYAAHVDDLKRHIGENALFVNGGQEGDPNLSEVFDRVEWKAPLPVWRQPYFRQPIRILHFARCYNYRRFMGTKGAWGG